MLHPTSYLLVMAAALCGVVSDGRATETAPQAERTAEVTTEEFKQLLASRSATVLDARPFTEYTMSHIPRFRECRPEARRSRCRCMSRTSRRLVGCFTAIRPPPSSSTATGRTVERVRGQSLAQELLDTGYSNVRRYQLGIPTWRAARRRVRGRARGHSAHRLPRRDGRRHRRP